MNIVSELRNYLITQGTITSDGSVIDRIPDTDDDSIMLLGIGGEPQNVDYNVFYANVEIWSRNADTATGYEALKSVFDKLNGLGNTAFTTAYVYFIHPLTYIESMGRDVNNRSLHKMIVKIIFREVIS